MLSLEGLHAFLEVNFNENSLCPNQFVTVMAHDNSTDDSMKSARKSKVSNPSRSELTEMNDRETILFDWQAHNV